jgi:subtilase family serine protease
MRCLLLRVLVAALFVLLLGGLSLGMAPTVSAQPTPCADLVITDFEISPVQPVEGQNAQIDITVLNQGTCASLSFVVQWRSAQLAPDGPSEDVAGLGPNASTTVSLVYAFPNAGNFTTVVEVDTDRTVDEIHENNNLEIFPVTVVPALPDLLIDDFTVVPANPTQGEPASINITVRNQGNLAAGPFLVQWKSDNTRPLAPDYSQQVDGLAAGATTVVSFQHIFPTLGDFTTVVNVDTDNTVVEADEQNNLEIFAVQVGEAKPDLAITAFDIGQQGPAPGFDPTQPVAGENALIRITVKNEGNAPSLSFVVQWKSDEFAPLGASSATVPGLDVGEETTVELVAVFRRPGNFETIVNVDTDNTVIESDEVNNVQITPVTVQARVLDVAVIEFSVGPAAGVVTSIPPDPDDDPADPLVFNPVVNRPAQAVITVKNIGNVPVDTFTVEWMPTLLSPAMDQPLVGGLKPGEEATLTFDFVYRTAGDFVTRAMADSENVILPEIDEQNNIKTLAVRVEPELPDLEITSFTVNPPSPVAGTHPDLIATFTVVIRNRGNSPAGVFDVHVRPAPLADILVKQVVGGLGVHESIELTFEHTYIFPGTFNAVAIVDPTLRVPEIFENNNRAELEVTVQAPTDDLDVIDILILPNPVNETTCPAPGGGGDVSAAKFGKATVNQNEPVKVCIYVQNLGNSPMRQFMVEWNPAEGIFPPLISEGTGTLKKQVDELVGGQVALIEHDFVYERSGEFRTLTFADADNVILETNEQNNRDIYNVEVLPTGPDLTILDLAVTAFLGGDFFDSLTPVGGAYQFVEGQQLPRECDNRFPTPGLQASATDAQAIVAQGQKIFACVLVKNEGDRPSGPFVVHWNPDSLGILTPSPQTLASQVADLAAGAEILLVFGYTYTKPGDFRTVAKADAANEVAELQEGDNEKILNVTVVATGPDLVITAMTITPVGDPGPDLTAAGGDSAAVVEPILTQGQEAEISITVLNQGNRPAGPFILEWNPDALGLITPSPATLSEQIDGLASFQSQTVVFRFTYEQHGTESQDPDGNRVFGGFRTIAKADAFNDVKETNEENNLNIVNVVVLPAPLNLTIDILELVALPEDDGSDTIVRGSPILARIEVSNQGDYPTKAFSVQWKPQGEFSAGGPFFRVDGLQPFEDRVVELQGTFFVAGPFDSFAEVDVFDEIIETDESAADNTDTFPVTVEPRRTTLELTFNRLNVSNAGEDFEFPGDIFGNNGEWVVIAAAFSPGSTCSIGGETIENFQCALTTDNGVNDNDTINLDDTFTIELEESTPLLLAAIGVEVDNFIGIPTGGDCKGVAFQLWTNFDYRGVGNEVVGTVDAEECGNDFDLDYTVTIVQEPPELAEGAPGVDPQLIELPAGLTQFFKKSMALPAGVIYSDEELEPTPKLWLPSISGQPGGAVKAEETESESPDVDATPKLWLPSVSD